MKLDTKGGVTRKASATAKSYAKNLRQAMTGVENTLWHHLRDKRFDGIKFRRQHPIDKYIVDFVCLRKQLVIELDGGQHCDNAARFSARERVEITRLYCIAVLE